MFDYQTQTASAQLVFNASGKADMAACKACLVAALPGAQMAAPALPGALTLNADNAVLHAQWHKGAQTDVLSLTLNGTTGAEDAATVQKMLLAILRQCLADLPVSAVEWTDSRVRVPAAQFQEALIPAAAAISPRRVVRHANSQRQRLSQKAAALQIETATATPPAAPHVQPRRVANAKPASTRRMDPMAARQLARLLPTIERTAYRRSANANAPIGAPRYDAHVQAYDAHLRGALRQELDSQPVKSTEERLSARAVSIGVATVSLPMAVPVIAYNLTRGEDMRAASLVMGLASFFFALDSTGTLAGLLVHL